MDNRLTDKQKKFALTYLHSGDRYKALADAGYSLATKSVTASQLLANPKIKDFLEKQSRALIEPNIDEITRVVKGLDKKEQACVETYKAFIAIKKEDNTTKYKYWELLCKLKGHFNESTTQNLFITPDGKPMGLSEIMDGTRRITGVLRELRFEAEVLRKQRKQASQVIDIEATDA